MSLAVLSDGAEALSKTLPGSILVLNDGSFRVTSLETPFGTKRVHGLPDIFISEKVDVPAKAVKQDWLIGSVGSIFMGVMTEGGLSGSQAAALTIQGQPACIEVAGTTGDAVSQLKVTVQGAAPKVMGIAAALGLLKVSPRLFKGGQEPACLLSGGGTPTPAAAAATDLTGAEFAIGSPLEPLYTARLQMMGLFSSGTSTCTAAQASKLICGLVGSPRLEEAITLCLACSASTIGSSPSPEQAGATGARSALLGAFSRVVHGIPPPALELAVVKMTAMATAGFALGQGCGGAILFQSVAESEPPALLPMSRGMDAGLAAVRLLNAAAPAPLSSPASLMASAGSGAALSPESALEAEISARRLALETIRAAKALSAAGGASSIPLAATTGGAPLHGLSYLRPSRSPPLPPFTDLELLQELGGADVVRRLAASAGNAAPLVSMSGQGSAATAVEAASDFSSILSAVRASVDDSLALEPAGSELIMASTSPADMECAGTRLRVVLRRHQELRAGRQAPSKASPEVAVHRQPRHGDHRSVKVVPASAPAERVFRAVGASLLEPMCVDSSSSARSASRGIALADPIAEARRLIDAYGRRAVGYFLSSGEVDGETSSDPPDHLVACRTAISGFISRWLDDVACPQRVRAAAQDTQLLRADIQSLDLNWSRIQVRFGGLPPKGAQWLAARPELALAGNSAILGRWGTLSGPLAYGDCERAARLFGPLLVTIQVELAGGAPVSEGDSTLGLLPLVQATAGISDEARGLLMQEAVERFALQHHEVRSNSLAKPADPEAIFLDAQVHAVQPISDAAASVQAGAAAGAAAAKAAIDAHKATLAPAAAPPIAGDGSTKWSDKRKADRDAKRLAKKQSLTAPAPAPAPPSPAGGPNQLALPTLPPPVIKPKVQVKQWEPFASGEPAADSIVDWCDRKGGGLVEILDRLHHFQAPTTGTDKFPCAWRAATGECRTHADPKKTCRKCENGAKPLAKVLSLAKAACRADFLAKVPPTSAVATAA